MKKLLLAILLMAGAVAASATDYYISPTGSDTTGVGSSGNPWKTWNKVRTTAIMAPDNRIILKSGTWTKTILGGSLPSTTCNTNALDGTSGHPVTIMAETPGLAYIQGDGSAETFVMTGCDWYVIDGIRFFSTDNSANQSANGTVEFNNMTHLVFKRNIVVGTNREANWQAIQLGPVGTGVRDSLFESNQVYNFHRHGFSVKDGSARNTFRLNYVNSRYQTDSANCTNQGTDCSWAGGESAGDEAFACYVCTESIFENNIVEKTTVAFSINATSNNTNNTYRGNIADKVAIGFEPDARGNTISTMPISDDNRDMVIIQDTAANIPATRAAVYLRATRQTTVDHVSVWTRQDGDADGTGYAAREGLAASGCGDGQYSGESLTNSIFKALTGGSEGVGLDTSLTICTAQSAHLTWSANKVWANGYPTAFSPSATGSTSTANYTLTATASTEPGFGNCRLWCPDGGNCRNAALDTNPVTGLKFDMGATVVYQTIDGTLHQDAAHKLWNTDGTYNQSVWNFPAPIAGLTDADSMEDIGSRLAIGTANGCTFNSEFAPTPTPSNTPTVTQTFTPSRTFTFTNTPTRTNTFTATNTATRTNTATNTPTRTNTFTPSNTPTVTPTFTPSNTPIPGFTNTPTNTPTNTATATPTITFTPSLTPAVSPTPTPCTYYIQERRGGALYSYRAPCGSLPGSRYQIVVTPSPTPTPDF